MTLEMEVDGVETTNNSNTDLGKFANLKAFVTAAREFEATHSESALNLMTRYLGTMENEWKEREKEMEERFKQAEGEYKALQKKLEQQSNKNSELEERVKQRDKRLEDAASAEAALRRELDQKDMSIKHLEKTVVERENLLYQMTTQLEEIKRVLTLYGRESA